MNRFTDDYLLYLLAQASGQASAAFHAELAQIGVPVSTWRILATLYPDAPASIGELAQSCLTKQPTMTRQIERLVAAGLVTRENAPQDRRRAVILLTPKGRALAKRLTERARAHEAQVLAGHDAAEIATIKSVLRGLMADQTGQR